MSFTKSFLGAAAALLLTAGGNAFAQTCTSDANCPQGFACHATTVNAPTESDCGPGATCPARPDASAPPPTVVMSCAPKTCSVDTDCGADMVCFAQAAVACPGSAPAAPPCGPDRKCDAGAPPKPPEESCTMTTTRTCAFKWQLPCNKDLDCGAGFSCKPSVTGSCSGGAGTPSSGGASAPSPGIAAPPSDAGAAPPMCTTTTSYPGYCQPTVATCTVDTDCPANWKCVEAPDTAVSDPAPGYAPRPADAGARTTVKRCASAFDTPARDSKGEIATPAPGMGGGTTQGGGDAAAPTAPPSAGNSATSKSSGCSVGSTGGSSGLGLLLGSFLALAIARRRRAR
jgi:MYXO-CTERM domain-containing protein